MNLKHSRHYQQLSFWWQTGDKRATTKPQIPITCVRLLLLNFNKKLVSKLTLNGERGYGIADNFFRCFSLFLSATAFSGHWLLTVRQWWVTWCTSANRIISAPRRGMSYDSSPRPPYWHKRVKGNRVNVLAFCFRRTWFLNEKGTVKPSELLKVLQCRWLGDRYGGLCVVGIVFKRFLMGVGWKGDKSAFRPRCSPQN